MSSSESVNSEIPLLTFNSLYNILREEKKNKSLQKLPEKFYEALEDYFKNKRSELIKLKDNPNERDKLKKEKFVLSNSRKIVNELMSLRCAKISEIAIKNKIFDEDILSKENILNVEDDFLAKIENAVSDLKEEINKK